MKLRGIPLLLSRIVSHESLIVSRILMGLPSKGLAEGMVLSVEDC